MTTWVGIDVSMETLDFAWLEGKEKNHVKIANDQKGFEAILRKAPGDARFVMEATGTYYFNLALFLHQAGRFVSVVNPLQTKSFMRSDLRRTKSDKTDAFAIAQFGEERKPGEWSPPAREISEMQQLLTLDDILSHQLVQYRNLEHAFCKTVHYSPEAIVFARNMIKDLKAQREAVMASLECLAEKVMPREIEIISSIPGVGRASAIRIAASVMDFNRFENGRKLVSFFGLSPTTKQSGTSVKSRGHISRMGGSKVRGTLYMCAMNALQLNQQCQRMWKRMKEAKKHGKVIMAAIMVKLVRQIHSMVIHDSLYNPSFH